MDHPQPLRDKGVHLVRPGPSLAVLFHLVQWHLEEPIVTIAHNIDLGRFAGSRLEALYNELVSRDGIDDGEALQYGAYALLTPDEAERYLLDFVDSYSLAERFSNALVVTSAYPLTWSRVIWSLDDFGSAEGTAETHYAGYQTDFLERGSLEITPASLGVLRAVWATIERLWQEGKAGGRINTALQYFYLAWRAHYIHQICLNLAVSLEVLFAPHSQSETTHQLAFNLARFHGSDRADRERIYRLTKKFYGMRSSIVHGGLPDDQAVADVTVEVFHLMAAVLRRLLVSDGLADTLNTDVTRKALWQEYLFAQ
jgi:hypothetical protein